MCCLRRHLNLDQNICFTTRLVFQKETIDGYFDNLESRNVFVSTNARFLEDGYVGTADPKKVVLQD